jgi:hypothetical protein
MNINNNINEHEKINEFNILLNKEKKVTKLNKQPIGNISESPYKKKQIPKSIKSLVWNKYIGQQNGQGLCQCCQSTEIFQMSFHCGHVISEFNGGKSTIDNLKPICPLCNNSMGKKNMNDFMNEHGLFQNDIHRKSNGVQQITKYKFIPNLIYSGWNVRENCDLNSKKLFSLKFNDIFDVVEIKDNWLRIIHNNKTGWAIKVFEGFQGLCPI